MLLKAASVEGLHDGEWRLCERSGWPDNQSFLNLVAWTWRKGEEKYFIVVNLSGQRSQARIRLPWDELTGKSWKMTDLFTGEMCERNGDEMFHAGLYVDLPPWGYHVLVRWLKIG